MTPGGMGPAAVLIEGRRIAAVVAPDAVPPGVPVYDYGEKVIGPGLVDAHVHVNEPGRTEWEGFETATLAAAAGGVTTLVDMPLNSDPVTTSLDAFRRKLDAAAARPLRVDVGFWGGVVPGNAASLAPLAEAGVLGFKCFTCFSGIDDFPASAEADLRRAMPILGEVGVPLLVHAELECPVDDLAGDDGRVNWRRYLTYLRSRPRRFEDEAIRMMVGLCRDTGCRTHIVHLSSSNALGDVQRAKAEGLPFTAETCPHYLTLSAEEVPDGDTIYKCAPPIREAENQALLWQGLEAGIIDFVISDHSPCVPALKRLDVGDFEAAWGGIASLALGLPAVWTRARARGITVPQLTRWMSEAPARFIGLGERKGALAPGYDADVVVWDPDAAFVLTAEQLKFRHRVSPYLGRRFYGVVEATWVGGALVARGGEAVGDPRGRMIRGGALEEIVSW